MAFMRYAAASVVRPSVSQRGWKKVRKASASPSRNLVSQASEILGRPFNPDDYLLTHCFPAGHKVLMADGTEKAIEDVEVGDLVLTHKGNVRPVTNLMRKQVDEDLVVIKAASVPEVSCTGEHPFYVIREVDAWCGIYPSYQGHVKCTFGGKQVCEKNTCRTNGSVPGWVDARDVRAGDRTYTPTLHRTRVSGDLNPNRMRLLGYYIAEGRVDKDHDGRLHSIRFSIHEDEIPTLGAEISRLMRMEFGVPTHSLIRNKKRRDKGVTLAFCSHEHAPWFLHHAGCGSRIKRLSPEVVWSPVDWQRQLVGAWVNGDGCYDGLRAEGSGNNGIRLSTSSDDLASQAVVLLDRAGIYSRLQRVQTKGREYQGRWIKGTDGWHIEVSASYLSKLADVVHWNVVGTAHKRLSTKGRYRYAASTLSTVKSVERRHYQGPVYNLSVQDDESYIVNRQAVHNCTIVASVDVDHVPNVKLGRVKVGSKTINRKYSDYFIQPQCSQFVNNNGDSWSRDVLLASYQTFIGSHNFLEHVQIEEQSKGRIIDAVARDIGDSVYVDILVATDRRHASLVQDIESGKIGTLSMGCSVEETICTKCGNVAVDETELCDCIKYSKLNTFFDDQGNKRVVAELCGHPDIEENAGNTFIEASWVSSPAFTGAVLRNILEPSAMPESMARRLQAVMEAPPPEWGVDGTVKAAAVRQAGWDEGGDEEGAEAPAAEEEAPLDKLVNDVYDAVKDRVRERVEQDIKGEEVAEALGPEDSTAWPNDTIHKEGTRRYVRLAAATAYRGSINALVRTASSDVAFLDGLAELNSSFGISVPIDVYRTALKVGSYDNYGSTRNFLVACRNAASGVLTPADARVLVRIGQLLTRLGSKTRPSQGDGNVT